MDRNEKIKFLKDIQKKIITLDDLKPKKLLRMVGYGDGPDDERGSIFFIDDKEVSETHFLEVEKKQLLQTVELGYGPEEE
jgi:hypothetical protein